MTQSTVIKKSKTKIDLETVIAELIRTQGFIYLTAKNLQVAPATIFNYINKYPKVKEALDSVRGKILDIAELKLLEAIQRGEPWAITFYLRTVGKHRGYTDKIEISGNIDRPLEVVNMTLEQWQKKQAKLQDLAEETVTYFNGEHHALD